MADARWIAAGAQERTRTSTSLRTPAPEAGASTIPPPGPVASHARRRGGPRCQSASDPRDIGRTPDPPRGGPNPPAGAPPAMGRDLGRPCPHGCGSLGRRGRGTAWTPPRWTDGDAPCLARCSGDCGCRDRPFEAGSTEPAGTGARGAAPSTQGRSDPTDEVERAGAGSGDGAGGRAIALVAPDETFRHGRAGPSSATRPAWFASPAAPAPPSGPRPWRKERAARSRLRRHRHLGRRARPIGPAPSATPRSRPATVCSAPPTTDLVQRPRAARRGLAPEGAVSTLDRFPARALGAPGRGPEAPRAGRAAPRVRRPRRRRRPVPRRPGPRLARPAATVAERHLHHAALPGTGVGRRRTHTSADDHRGDAHCLA